MKDNLNSPTLNKIIKQSEKKINYTELALKGEFYRMDGCDEYVDEVAKIFFSHKNIKRIQTLRIGQARTRIPKKFT